jgi:hypothetical protein
MALLPEPKNTTVAAIVRHYEAANANLEKPRPHLGASIIGKECERALWYDFRWATRVKFGGRMLRLFDTGNRQEFRMVADLRNAGLTVHDKDPKTGKQFQFKDHGGHFSGSMDACMQGVIEAPKAWHVGEFKTHNGKSFAKLVKEGVKKSKPQHWHQMNTYEGWSKMQRAFYLAVNKDNDELYGERCEFDMVEFERDRAKAKRVIEAAVPPAKINTDPTWFECKFCDHHATCHVNVPPAVSCRTCIHSTPVIEEGSQEGRWKCERYNVDLTTDQQLSGCESHLYIPDLIAYGEVIDASDEWITYKHRSKDVVFANSTPVGMPDVSLVSQGSTAIYPSAELHALHPNLVGDPKVEELRNELDGTVVLGKDLMKKATAAPEFNSDDIPF